MTKNIINILILTLLLIGCNNSRNNERVEQVIGLGEKLVIVEMDTLTNSFEEIYKANNALLNYSYDYDLQIHNYSNNWDFDNDGINDEVFFVGTGGAHLYYFLRIILSSDKSVRDFNFLQSDFPLLSTNKTMLINDFNPEDNQTVFAVIEIKDGENGIFIQIDNSTFLAFQQIFKGKGIRTNKILLTFKNGKTILRDFEKY